MTAAETIGFIGLGVMGRPMAGHLLEKRFPLVVHSRSRDAVDELVAAGAVRPRKLVKVLGDGELSKKLTVRVHRFSKSARERIEAAGGTCESPPDA